MPHWFRTTIAATALICSLPASVAWSDVKLPAIFGSHMVLQQGQANPVWGWADADEAITVSLGNQVQQTTASSDGRWRVKLTSLPVGGPHVLTIKGNNTVTLEDVLIGEVWVCSGQSNMQMAVQSANDPDLEIATAKFPRIRLISVPQVGTQEPQKDFQGEWKVCSPQTVGDFSAVGYFFGRQLHQTLEVPIGLIDNSWGGSACEAWVKRDLLEADSRYQPLIERWQATESTYDHEAATATFERRLVDWQAKVGVAKQEGKPLPRKPRPPRNPLAGQHRPGNLYNGVLLPTIGYGIRGTIWYQGEANAGRAYQYRHLFPLMIRHWRDEWQQGDFPFYWVQLADFQGESAEPQESAWAELREAQTMTLGELPNTGQAVITDLGEATDIHPKNKQDVGKRLARLALARDYGVDLCYQSPRYQAMEIVGSKIVVTFDVGQHRGGALDTFDVRDPLGFAIAGSDKKFVWRAAKVIGRDKVEVWTPDVEEPIAVRYAWANNPVCNLQNQAGLPANSFRSDDWPGVTIDVHK